MRIGKYLTNFGIITSLLGGIGAYKQTSHMPRDVRRYLVWATWALSLVVAIVAVAKDEDREGR